MNKSQDKEISTTVPKIRMNILASTNLDGMYVVNKEYVSNIHGIFLLIL